MTVQSHEPPPNSRFDGEERRTKIAQQEHPSSLAKRAGTLVTGNWVKNKQLLKHLTDSLSSRAHPQHGLMHPHNPKDAAWILKNRCPKAFIHENAVEKYFRSAITILRTSNQETANRFQPVCRNFTRAVGPKNVDP
jgi:hypothetical protein